MLINIKDNGYKLIATLSDGRTVDLTNAVQTLEWSDNEGELAQRATIKLSQVYTNEGFLSELLMLCTRLRIIANNKTSFEGLIWEWSYTSTSSQTFDVMGYDNMIYMQKSKDNNYFSKNKTTKTIVSSICKKWDIPLSYKWGSKKHKKIVYRGQTIANQIISTLEETRYKVGKKYVIKFQDGTLIIDYYGTNKDVYVFTGEEVIATEQSRSMDTLVTKVKITGKESSSGKIPIKATVKGNTKYGTIQEFVSSTSTSVKEAKEEARKIIADKGKPKETIRMDAPDVPELRKGDKIKVIAGSLNGYYYVLGITHNANERTMNLSLEVASDGT